MSDATPRPGDIGGSRFVTGCAHREVSDRDPALADVPRVEPDDRAQEMLDEGIAFEESVFEQLFRLHRAPNLRDSDDTERATLEAMARGDRVIIGPSLPITNHRGGRPDVLVRHGEAMLPNGRWAYLPVDVKNSKALEGGAKESVWQVSSLENPWFETTTTMTLGKGVAKNDQSLQLAHYWLMLADLGHAPDIEPVGATITPDLTLVWRPLDGTLDSFIATARQEWDLRWAAVNAMRDGLQRHTRPFLHSNCPTCHWREHCESVVVAEQHVSLVAGVAEGLVRNLASVDIHTVSDLAACDPTSADVRGLKVNKTLAKAIDAARAMHSGARTPFVMRGVSPEPLVRADVEIDFDIENDGLDRVYLYGCHISERTSTGTWSDGSFRSFHSFDATDPSSEATLLVEFWTWLHDTVAATHASGRTVAVYCYSGTSAEIPRMREAVLRNPDHPGMPTVELVEGLADQPWWVDMFDVVKRFVWPTRGQGLKYVAPLAGFSWTAEDASGSNSISWYRIASDPSHPEREAMVAKLLRYNADDVLATKVLRQWLDDGVNGRGWSIPPIETLD